MICEICGYRYGDPSVFDSPEDWEEGLSEFDRDEFGICPVCIEKLEKGEINGTT